MSAEADTSPQADAAPPPTAGELLRNAREALGASTDAIAQQLKLAPRQVQALEDNDFAQLPGRTFVRGFLRNYARLVRLDPDLVLSSLPEGNAPSLDRPALSPTTRVMGELPAEAQGKPSNARWAIPLALVAIVAIAAAYQFARPLVEQGRAVFAQRPAPATLPAPEPAAPAPAVAESAPAPEVVTAAPSPVVEPPAAAAAGDAPVVFVFRGTSWIEVKDARGQVVLSTMGYPGATHAVGGALPLEVVLGNAEAVTVTVRGAPFDTTAYIRQNVAKFTVK
ncbi:MAG: helix-turn-helix domain-containing protein [Burkholderiales bacterium]|nr:helix-turn-helix domain-containing protein [Burkholderiales bacterium]